MFWENYLGNFIMSVRVSCLVSVLLLFGLGCSASNYSDMRAKFGDQQNLPQGNYRGWNRLAARLLRDGIDGNKIAAVYQSPKMPEYKEVTFKLNPVENPAEYKKFYQASMIGMARSFLSAHSKSFAHAEQTFGVNKEIIAALLLIETKFGKDTGKYLVIERLSRLANIAEPRNVKLNAKRLIEQDSKTLPDAVEKRAIYVEELFYPEILALFELADKQNIDLFQFKGSSAGAFGYPQFIPTSYLKYAVDGNNDGVISLFREEDAIASIANYLVKAGWTKDGSVESRRKALWAYNRSNSYVDAALKVMKLIK